MKISSFALGAIALLSGARVLSKSLDSVPACWLEENSQFVDGGFTFLVVGDPTPRLADIYAYPLSPGAKVTYDESSERWFVSIRPAAAALELDRSLMQQAVTRAVARVLDYSEVEEVFCSQPPATVPGVTGGN